MKRISKIILILLFLFTKANTSVFGQCVINLSNNSIYGFNNPLGSGGYSGFLCSGTDSVGTVGVNGYYDGDGYTIKLVGGSRVTFSVDSCTGNPVSLTVTDSANQIIPGAYAGPACPNSLNFTVPYTGTFVIVLNRNGVCGGGGTVRIGQAYAKIKSGTTIPDCPDANIVNDTICGAVELFLDSPFVQGNTSLAYPTDPIDGYITSIGCTCSVPNNTLWYSYTAAISSDTAYIYLTSDAGSNFHSWMNVFVATNTSNTCNGNLFFLGCQEGPNDTAGIDTVIIPIYGLNAGTTFYFMIDGYNGSTGGFSIALRSTELSSDVKELKRLYDISMYPNPAGSFINIQSKPPLQGAEIRMENLLGQEVFFHRYDFFENEKLRTDGFPDGLYNVRIISRAGSFVKKIRIQKQ